MNTGHLIYLIKHHVFHTTFLLDYKDLEHVTEGFLDNETNIMMKCYQAATKLDWSGVDIMAQYRFDLAAIINSGHYI
jgi:hypothetical protein